MADELEEAPENGSDSDSCKYLVAHRCEVLEAHFRNCDQSEHLGHCSGLKAHQSQYDGRDARLDDVTVPVYAVI